MSFNPTAAYATFVDAEGEVYLLQSGVVYDRNGNSWSTIPKSKRGGYTAGIALTDTQITGVNNGQIIDSNGGILALTEQVTEVLANPSATTTTLTGVGSYYAYRCTVAAGNITVYDNTAASGKVLVATTALTTGSFPIYGSGTNKSVGINTGITVVLSGAATVYIAQTT